MDLAAGDDHPPHGEGRGPVELVAGEDDRRAPMGCVGDELVDEVATVGVQAGVGLVEQPQLRPAGNQAGERGAAALSGRQTADGDVAEPPVEAEPRKGRFGLFDREARGSHGEADVLLDGQVVVQEPAVAEEADPSTQGPAIARQIVSEHLTGALGQAVEARAGAQERGLPRPVRAREMDDFSALDEEVCSSEGGEASEEDDGASESDRGHGDRIQTTGGLGVVTRQPPGVPLSSPSVDWRRFVAGIGRTFIASGVLILLFVAYQLWGTGLSEARAQDRLRADFLDALQSTTTTARPTTTTTRVGTDGTTSSTDPSATTTTTAPAPVARPTPTGEAVAIIRIPKIDVTKAVIEGVSVGALKKGPGHYPSTPLPGQPGNAAIAGHRTTYGAPFFRLDELVAGDRIEVTTKQGDFVYRVTESKIVSPSQNEVLAPTEDNRLTLTTCHPRFSAAKRMIVTASLTDEPVEALPPPVTVPEDTPDTIPGDEPEDEEPVDVPTLDDDASVSGESVSKWPAIGWGALAGFIWLVTWLLSKKWGRIPAYAMGVPVFLVVLFVFFENFARLLPANV